MAKEREVACKQITTKMFNSIIDGDIKRIQSLVTDNYKDGTGFFVFEQSIGQYLEEKNASQETITSFRKLCKDITKRSIHSYEILRYEHSSDYNFVFILVKGVNLKKLFLEDYAHNLDSHLESYKNNHQEEYNKLVLSQGKEIADQMIMDNGCQEYFQQITAYFDEIDQTDYRVRLVFKDVNGQQKIYKTEVEL
ncbi:MAG: hypothetical protein Q4C49_03440 [Bacillota bacterium]|nr:hypothetical protein [Bacillota bacterium]